MSFEIRYHGEVEADVAHLDRKTLARIKRAIESRLAARPEAYGKPLRFTLHGLWSLRVGDYRVIYKIDGRQVLVLKIGHRRNVYEEGGGRLD